AVAPENVAGVQLTPHGKTLTARGDLRWRSPGMEYGRDLDRPVVALPVLDDRDDRAADRHRGAVQRMDEPRRRLLLGPVAGVQPARLVVGRVRAGGELAVALLPGEPGLDVVLL